MEKNPRDSRKYSFWAHCRIGLLSKTHSITCSFLSIKHYLNLIQQLKKWRKLCERLSTVIVKKVNLFKDSSIIDEKMSEIVETAKNEESSTTSAKEVLAPSVPTTKSQSSQDDVSNDLVNDFRF